DLEGVGQFEGSNIVIPSGKNVTLNTFAQDEGGQTVYHSSVISCKTLSVAGTLSIPAATNEAPASGLQIAQGGSLSVTGTLTPGDGAFIEVGANATVTGVTLYDSNGTNTINCNGTDNTTQENYIYSVNSGKWIRDEGGQGGGAQNVTVASGETRNSSDLGEIANLTVEAGGTLNINSFVEADSVTINGTVSIQASANENEPNGIRIRDESENNQLTLSIGEGGSITAAGGAVLDIAGGVAVSGLTLYDTDGSTEFVCNGTNNTNREVFDYNSTDSKWIRGGGAGGQGGGAQDVTVASGETRNSSDLGEIANLTVDAGGTLNIDSFIEADNVTINGTVSIQASANENEPNGIRIRDEGDNNFTFSVGQDASITAAGGAVLDIAGGVVVSGLTLYDTDGTNTFTCDGTNNANREVFDYNATGSKWIRGGAGGQGGEDPVETFTVKIPSTLVPNSGSGNGTITVTGNIESNSDSENYKEYTFACDDYASVSIAIAPKDGSGYMISTVTVNDVADNTLTDAQKRSGKTYTISSQPAADTVYIYNVTFETDRAAMLDDIEGHEYAYYPGTGTDSEKIGRVKQYLAVEIWYEYFAGERPYSSRGIYADISALESNLSASAISPATANDPAGITNGLSYITFTMTSGTESNEIKVYLLENEYQFLLEVGACRAYHVITGNAADENGIYADMVVSIEIQTINGEEEGVWIFGNGACAVGNLGTEDEDAVIGWHITQEHSRFCDYTCSGGVFYQQIGQINGRLVLCKKRDDAATVKVTGSESAGGWDFADLEWFAATDDPNDPGEATVYIASDSISIENVNYDNTSGEDVGVSSVSLDTSKLPAGAASVTQNGNAFTVTFNTNYDEIPLVLTMSDGSTKYTTVKRVALYMNDTGFTGSKIRVFHSSNAVDYTVMETESGKAIYGTYYYPTGDTAPTDAQSDARPVDLFVTVNTSSGSEKYEISNSEAITYHDSAALPEYDNGTLVKGYLGEDLTNHYYDDFIIWQGTDEEFAQLTSIDVIAYEVGDSDSFGGVKAGSGSGVRWEYQNFGH
ncbi:MAG: hypothetical protein K5669_10090, partial [Lachnospiraceae bacterium]|nr:hypothetical protein [Lachnospiraceae bacterium]